MLAKFLQQLPPHDVYRDGWCPEMYKILFTYPQPLELQELLVWREMTDVYNVRLIVHVPRQDDPWDMYSREMQPELLGFEARRVEN